MKIFRDKPWRKWLVAGYLASGLLNIGINIAIHGSKPGEILQFLAGWVSTTILAGAVTYCVLSWRSRK